MGSKVVTLSVIDAELAWWQEFEDTIAVGKRSEYILRILKEHYLQPGKTKVEKEFDQYCLKNNLSKDAQLGLLMGPYRVWGGDPDEM